MMKLHFYILEGIYRSNPKLTYSECEVVEKPKTYKAISKFPGEYLNSFIKKEDIGRLIGYNHNVVVLEEKNNKKVKEIFSSYLEKVIDIKKQEVEKLEKILNCVNELEE